MPSMSEDKELEAWVLKHPFVQWVVGWCMILRHPIAVPRQNTIMVVKPEYRAWLKEYAASLQLTADALRQRNDELERKLRS